MLELVPSIFSLFLLILCLSVLALDVSLRALSLFLGLAACLDNILCRTATGPIRRRWGAGSPRRLPRRRRYSLLASRCLDATTNGVIKRSLKRYLQVVASSSFANSLLRLLHFSYLK